MTVEIALVISIVSVAFSVFFGLKNYRRADTKEMGTNCQTQIPSYLTLA